MMDPMANLDGGDEVPGAPSASVDPSHASPADVYDPLTLNLNLRRIDKIRSFMGIISGCVAGICGFTGWEGLVCFLVLHIFVALSIWSLKMNFNLKAYTRQSLIGYITTNLQQCALSFTLFWTLFYGLVYLF